LAHSERFDSRLETQSLESGSANLPPRRFSWPGTSPSPNTSTKLRTRDTPASPTPAVAPFGTPPAFPAGIRTSESSSRRFLPQHRLDIQSFADKKTIQF